jgi:hypothetical protein
MGRSSKSSGAGLPHHGLLATRDARRSYGGCGLAVKVGKNSWLLSALGSVDIRAMSAVTPILLQNSDVFANGDRL